MICFSPNLSLNFFTSDFNVVLIQQCNVHFLVPTYKSYISYKMGEERYQFTYYSSSSTGLINLRRRRLVASKRLGSTCQDDPSKWGGKRSNHPFWSLILMTFKMTFINLMSVLNEHKWCFNNKQLDFNEAFNFSREVYVLKFLKNSNFFWMHSHYLQKYARSLLC